MQLLIEELSQVLAEEYRHFERLFAMTETEQQFLVTGDTDGLDRSLTGMREMVARAQSLAERRQLILCRVSEHCGVPVGELTLRRLSEIATGMAGVRLERLRADFAELLGKLHKRNGSNLLLIRNSLDMNDRAVRLILGETGQVHFYGDTGRAEAAAGPKVLSRRM